MLDGNKKKQVLRRAFTDSHLSPQLGDSELGMRVASAVGPSEVRLSQSARFPAAVDVMATWRLPVAVPYQWPSARR